MIHNFWRWIQLWLPFWVILKIYKHNEAIPANIRMKSGRNLKAIMITTEYGVLFTEEKYTENRLKKLVERQKEISYTNDLLLKEINELTYLQREQAVGNIEDGV